MNPTTAATPYQPAQHWRWSSLATINDGAFSTAVAAVSQHTRSFLWHYSNTSEAISSYILLSDFRIFEGNVNGLFRRSLHRISRRRSIRLLHSYSNINPRCIILFQLRKIILGSFRWRWRWYRCWGSHRGYCSHYRTHSLYPPSSKEQQDPQQRCRVGNQQ